MINRSGNGEPSYYIIISIQSMYDELNIEISIWMMTNRRRSVKENGSYEDIMKIKEN